MPNTAWKRTKLTIRKPHIQITPLSFASFPPRLLLRDGYQLKCHINQGFTNHPNPMATFRRVLMNIAERGNGFRVIPSTQLKKELGVSRNKQKKIRKQRDKRK